VTGVGEVPREGPGGLNPPGSGEQSRPPGLALRRFVKRPAGGPPAGLPPSIQEILAARAAARAGRDTGVPEGAERCEMCREVLSERHGHVVDLEKRALSCTCRACYLLFTHEGAAGGRYRAVPEDVYHDPGRPLTDADWSELQIPVAMAFFFYNSALGRVVAGYPSPGGATECELDLAAWDRLAAAYPLLGALAPDVEAIFVNRTEQGNQVFLIPVDECYSLVGELRMKWQGFDGGAEARAALATFLDGLRRRAVPLKGRALTWPT
jgi:Family of unknown function (DUF5947)